MSNWRTTRKNYKERGAYLFENGMWSDCSFKVYTNSNEEQIVQGHKLFLALASPVFEAMFYGDMAEEGPITIPDIRADVFQALLRYIYTETVNFDSFDHIVQLYYCADKYIIPHLKGVCMNYLDQTLHYKTVCQAFEFAKLFNKRAMMDKCLTMISTHIKQILEDSSFNNAGLNTIITIIEQKQLDINSELELFSALEKYVGENNLAAEILINKPNKILSIRDALKKIRFLTLTCRQFAEGPANSDLLTLDEKLRIFKNICSPKFRAAMPDGFSLLTSYRTKPDIEEDSDDDTMTNYKKRFCCLRQLLGVSMHSNPKRSVCQITFRCDKNICIYGLQIVSQVHLFNKCLRRNNYKEQFSVRLYEKGCPIRQTLYSNKAPYNSLIEVYFDQPAVLFENKDYTLRVDLQQTGFYVVGACSNETMSDEVLFTFQQLHDSGGLIRSILYTILTV